MMHNYLKDKSIFGCVIAAIAMLAMPQDARAQDDDRAIEQRYDRHYVGVIPLVGAGYSTISGWSFALGLGGEYEYHFHPTSGLIGEAWSRAQFGQPQTYWDSGLLVGYRLHPFDVHGVFLDLKTGPIVFGGDEALLRFRTEFDVGYRWSLGDGLYTAVRLGPAYDIPISYEDDPFFALSWKVDPIV